jgi:nucleotide-binding universal stress UspA family protein
MYRRLLVAIDGSPVSQRVLEHAIALAKARRAALRVVHVLDTGLLALGIELGLDVKPLAEAHRSSPRQLLARALETVDAAGIQAEIELLETGAPGRHTAHAIADDAARWEADAVVLGTHGHPDLGRRMLGSVAERVARFASVPIVLIPPAEPNNRGS